MPSSSVSPRHDRFVEIDLLRSIAIVMMIVYHTLFDLATFYNWPIDVYHGPWRLFARATAILFLLLAGVSTVFLRNSAQRALLRSVRILSAGFLVTAATLLLFPASTIHFGILHLIAVGTILLWICLPLKELLLPLGFLLLASYPFLAGVHLPSRWLLPIGMPPIGYTTFDYFPLLPWLGWIVFGGGLGHLLYVRWPSWRSSLPPSSTSRWKKTLVWPGRHSLAVYLLHQPIVLAFLWLVLGSW